MTLKKWQSTYQNNHLRLMRLHLGFVIFYLFVSIIWNIFAFKYGQNSILETVFINLVFFLPLVFLHALLAYGSFRQVELSRKASEVIFAIMLLGFPIGTLLSVLYFLPKTVWKQPE